MTQYEASQEEIGYMDLELNQRAIGYYLGLKDMVSIYGLPEYITLVGVDSCIFYYHITSLVNAEVL